MNLKKIAYYSILWTLTLGASLIIGFLSFGGMLALVPIINLAILSAILAIVYEGEIYLQNIQEALNKLFFKPYKLQYALAYELLAEELKKDETCEFFKTYKAYLAELKNNPPKFRKQELKEELKRMQKMFAMQIFAEQKTNIAASYDIDDWMINNQEKVNALQSLLKTRKLQFNFLKILSIVVALSMSIGTSYLLIEAFCALTIAIFPPVIAGLALIAGIAYGLLVYNAITDMIQKGNVQKKLHSIKQELKLAWEEGKLAKIGLVGLKTLVYFVLFVVSIALTIATFGTWQTIIKNSKPLWNWLLKIPKIEYMIPFTLGIATLGFNTENTLKSIEALESISSKSSWNIGSKIKQYLRANFLTIKKIYAEQENLLQLINPFRVILKILDKILPSALFCGHTVSVGVTADRVSGIPESLIVAVSSVYESILDLSYFVKEIFFKSKKENTGSHISNTKIKSADAKLGSSGSEHKHTHSILPTLVISMFLLPFFIMSTVWDWTISKFNSLIKNKKPTLSFVKAWEKNLKHPEQKESAVQEQQNNSDTIVSSNTQVNNNEHNVRNFAVCTNYIWLKNINKFSNLNKNEKFKNLIKNTDTSVSKTTFRENLNFFKSEHSGMSSLQMEINLFEEMLAKKEHKVKNEHNLCALMG